MSSLVCSNLFLSFLVQNLIFFVGISPSQGVYGPHQFRKKVGIWREMIVFMGEIVGNWSFKLIGLRSKVISSFSPV